MHEQPYRAENRQGLVVPSQRHDAAEDDEAVTDDVDLRCAARGPFAEGGGDFLDPEPALESLDGEDRLDFIRWTVKSVLKEKLTAKREKQLNEATQEFSAAAFASLRAELKAKAKMAKEKFTFEDVREIMADQIPPAIADTRRYQTLQALVNCTRRSLLPDPKTTDKERRSWETELRELEARGIR